MENSTENLNKECWRFCGWKDLMLKYYWQFCRWEDSISKYDQQFCRREDLLQKKLLIILQMGGLDIKYDCHFCKWEDSMLIYYWPFCRWEDLMSGEPARFLKWTPGQPNGLHHQVKSNKMFNLQINRFGFEFNLSKRIAWVTIFLGRVSRQSGCLWPCP